MKNKYRKEGKGMLDYRVSWQEASSGPERTGEDVFIDSSPVAEGFSVTGEDVSLEDAENPLPEHSLSGSKEEFEWTSDREKALDEALSQAEHKRIPVVHQQLDQIRTALEKGQLQRELAEILLGEAEEYLDSQLKRRREKTAVNSLLVDWSRSLTSDSLNLYREVCGLLREFLNTEEPIKLTLARQISEEASSILLTARSTLVQAKPEEAEPDGEDAASGNDGKEDLQ